MTRRDSVFAKCRLISASMWLRVITARDYKYRLRTIAVCWRRGGDGLHMLFILAGSVGHVVSVCVVCFCESVYKSIMQAASCVQLTVADARICVIVNA